VKRIVVSFLNLLCEVCCAERARVRLAVPDRERAVVIVDQRLPSAGAHEGPRVDGGIQLSLLENAGTAGGLAISPATTHGAVIESSGAGEWRISRRVSGLDLELEVALHERGAGFINERISRAAAFFDLFEALLDGRHAPGHSEIEEHPGAPAFNPPLLGQAPSMIDLKRMIAAVSTSDISVLIEGESGTGKEVVAQNVHRLSRRQLKPLVIASSLEMPHSLLQSELFGHAEGAFTGASRDRAGLIESAAGGTFFLDEIGEMPLSLQAALLRVLQEKEIRRIGESRRRRVDVRFIFATNRNLLELVRKGRFRTDLYFRIAGVRLRIPPLRARKEDVMPLANFFLSSCARSAGRGVPSLAAGAARRLIRYRWPGNVRELKNEIERLVAFHGGEGAITAAMLSPHIDEADDEDSGADTGGNLPEAIQRLERALIGDALRRFAGNRTRAAAELGITRQGLLKKMKRLGDRVQIKSS
jgi:transcriptional regulator with PAS, ATPase and Fis domain